MRIHEDTNNQFDSLKNEKDTTQSEYSFNAENQWKEELSFINHKNDKNQPKEVKNKIYEQEVQMQASRTTCAHHLLNVNTKQYSSGDIKASITIILMLVLEYYLDLKVIAELWWMHLCSSSCKKWSTLSNVFIKGQ